MSKDPKDTKRKSDKTIDKRKSTKKQKPNSDSDDEKGLFFIKPLFLNKIIEDFEKQNNTIKTETEKKEVCENPLCNHKEWSHSDDKLFYVHEMKQNKMQHIKDIIELGKLFHCKRNKEYNGISLRLVHQLIEPLTEFENMIGMKNVKENIVNQIVFFLQGFNQKDKCLKCIDCISGLRCPKNNNDDMLHTMITGPPGVGKTQVGKILGRVYKELGILSKGHLKIVSRSDLVGQYLGQTAIKTQKVIDDAMGGVLFIDEAYSLGNPEGRDSFSKECLDTLNQNLSEKRDLLCIIAGYKDALDTCFFNYNEGLRRRFTFSYNIDGYNSDELTDIFYMKIQSDGWKIESDILKTDSDEEIKRKKEVDKEIRLFFKKNHKFLPHYGGDIETLYLQCKICHGKRVLFETPDKRKLIILKDIKEGFDIFVSNRKYKEETQKDKMSDSVKSMYI
jgi:hypothetical protein